MNVPNKIVINVEKNVDKNKKTPSRMNNSILLKTIMVLSFVTNFNHIAHIVNMLCRRKSKVYS